MRKHAKASPHTRLLSLLLALVMTFSLLSPALGGTALAADTTTGQNLINSPSFEEAGCVANGTAGKWGTDFGAVRIKEGARTGSYSVKLTATNDGVEYRSPALTVGASYTFSFWAKATDPAGTECWIGAKSYGGAEIKTRVDSAEWKQYSVKFTYSGTGQPQLYAWTGKGGSGPVYVDDAALVAETDLATLKVTNGTLAATFKSSYTGTPTLADFTDFSYQTSLDAGVPYPLTITNSAWDSATKTFTMSFTPIAAEPVVQKIAVTVRHKPTAQTLVVDYDVAASGGDPITAVVQTFTPTNGKLTLVLDKAPTVTPVAGDFAFQYKVGNGQYQRLIPRDFTYARVTKTVTFNFSPFAVGPTAQTFTIKATYKGVDTTADLVLEASAGRTFYVSATGSDTNDGLSESKPFQSIDKLNTILFQAGDQILFKKGDTFVGAFKPQGSGMKGHPIVMASYGDGTAKPILRPGETDWKAPLMSADTYAGLVNVNNGITFYNQSYWTVKDLELFGRQERPKAGKTYSTYNRAINVTGEDGGELTDLHFENLTIHHFYGPNSNIGKSSGGILFETQAPNGAPAADHIPTTVNNIRITDCEIYEVGRSGINFVSVWAKRTDETNTKWGPGYKNDHGGNRPNYTRTAYKNFYVGNNIFHDIQGDACIVDTCDDAVLENNLVYRTCQAAEPGGPGGVMAVGFFNWNSNRTIFQYNEVHNTYAGGDGQGIEIDAINDQTLVQYNYLHDNHGGTFMFCTTGGLYSFDGTYRYNILESDGVAHGMFDYRSNSFNSKLYNNVIYIEPDSLDTNGNIKITGYNGTPGIDFRNNIFYYSGETAKPANGFVNGTYRSNFFYNFTNKPADADPGYPNLNLDPKLANPGSGVTGTTAGDVTKKGTVDGYKLLPGSPAINAGCPVVQTDWEKAMDSNRDYWDNPVSGIPDVGVHETGTVTNKLASNKYPVDQTEHTVTLPYGALVSAAEMKGTLVLDSNVTATITRAGALLSDNMVLQAGDSITTSHASVSLSYTVRFAQPPVTPAGEVPLAGMTATSGSNQPGQEASKALDNDTTTIWHSAWTTIPVENRYIQLDLGDRYSVTGVKYLPRNDLGNGTYNGYRVETSLDGQTFTQPQNNTGTWSWTAPAAYKTATIPATEARYVRLYAVTSVGNFASAAEVRVLGTPADVTAPGAPTAVTATDLLETGATISWTAPADSDVAGYRLYNGSALLATATASPLVLTGLTAATQYTISVKAFDKAGNESAAGSVTFSTTVAVSTTAPILTVTSYAMPKDAVTATYTTTNTAPANTAMKVYAAAAGNTLASGVTAAWSGTTLTLTFAAVPTTTGSYFISAKEGAKPESARVAVTVTHYPLSSDNTIKTSKFEVKVEDISVPVTTLSAPTASELKAGVTIHERATMAVKTAGGQAAADSAVLADGMKLVVTAENGTEKIYTVRVKNTYNYVIDFVNNQQGNLWFAQTKSSAGVYSNMTDWTGQYRVWGGKSPDWVSVGLDDKVSYAAGVLCDDIQANRTGQGHSMAFRAPVSGVVELSFAQQPKLRSAQTSGGTTHLVITKNGETISGRDYSLPNDTTALNIAPFTIEVAAGDMVRLEAKNVGSTSQAAFRLTPVFTYQDASSDATGAPAVSNGTYTMPDASAKTATYTTTNTAPANTAMKVYTAAAGDTLASGVTAAWNGTTLTLTLTAVPTAAATYYVTATAAGKTESTRVAVTVNPYSPPAPTYYTVTVTGGTGGGTEFEAGDSVTVTANNAGAGYRFSHWTCEAGNVNVTGATNSSFTFTMPAKNVALTARYAALPTVTAVVVSPAKADVQKGATQQFNAVVTGEHSPAQTVVWTVEGGISATTISEDGLLTVSANETAQALTVKATSTVDSTKNGKAAVTVTTVPVTRYTLTVVDGTGAGEYEAGVNVTVTATIPANKVFGAWTAEGVELTQAQTTQATITFAMPANDVTLTASFETPALDTKPIDDAIADANAAKADVIINNDSSQVLSGTKFVTQEVMDELDAAIEAAEAAKAAAQTDLEVTAAALALNNAVAVFLDARQEGTYIYTPPSKNTTTETVKNPDGSTTKTVTDKRTGTTTATTTSPDGDKSVVVTEKDGTVSETLTKKDGYKSETTKQPDGAFTNKTTEANGVKTSTVGDAAGEISSQVTLPKGMTSANVTIPAPKESITAGTVAVRVLEDGTEKVISSSVQTEGGLSFKVSGDATIKLVDNTKHFADVADKDWFSNSVRFTTSRELFQGVSKDSFGPTANMTNGMLLTVLARYDGQDTAKGDTWDAVGAAWGKELGMTDGLDIDADITREGLALMLYTYAGSPEVGKMEKSFDDAAAVSEKAVKAMAWAVNMGIINGKNGTQLDAAGSASRAEVATMLQRFVELRVK